MSLVDKIPPLVSAIAFGYGIGMAAPEGAVKHVDASMRHYATTWLDAGVAPGVGQRHAYPAGEVFRGPKPESDRLAKLRSQGDPRGASCSLDRPFESRARAQGEAGLEDDDLDSAGSEAISRLQMPDLKLAVTKRTIKYVRFFARTERGRSMFESWLKRGGRYMEMIQDELRTRRLPEDLTWVAMIESGFDARAKSPAGAVGLWQFMPSTGGVYGLRQNKHLDERRNPRLATRAAAHHLRDLYMRFEDWALALAAYNMGYEQLLDAIDRYNTTDFNELARQHAIPDETASYVPKIAAAAIIANNLDHFGFADLKLMKPVESAEIAVPPGVSFKVIAKGAGVPLATIKNLNPDMLGDRTPPGKGDWLVMIPPETVAKAQVTLPVLLRSEPGAHQTDGDVLDQVDLLGGRSFKRPAGDESLLEMLPKPKRRTLRDPELGEAVDDGDELPRRKKRETVLLKVGEGETLVGIARRYAMDVEDLARDNHLGVGDKLKSGTMLKLKVRKEVLEAEGAAKDDAKASPEKGAEKGHEKKGEDRAKEERAAPEKRSKGRRLRD